MRKRIGVREVRSLEPHSVLWDSTVIGFGVRRQYSDAAIFFLKYRTQAGRQRWYKIGRFGSPWSPDDARDEARRLLGDIARGGDPAAFRTDARRGSTTVAQLCDAYLDAAKAGRLMKKASTVLTDESRIKKHIMPRLGSLPVTAVGRDDIEGFLHGVAANGGKGTATRTTNLLGAIFSFAITQGLRSDNPAKGVKRFADGKRDRRFSDDEYKRLGAALTKAVGERIWPPAIMAVRFIALTGWRSGEALALRWGEVDLPRRTATLSDTKTGRSMRPLSTVACDILAGISRSSDLVFQPSPGSFDGQWFKTRWNQIFRLGDLPSDLGMHVLRHSFASLAADIGLSEPTIAALIGHKGRTITSRYVHSADAVLLAAADSVANRTADLMGERIAGATVIPLSR
jgi:integrase